MEVYYGIFNFVVACLAVSTGIIIYQKTKGTPAGIWLLLGFLSIGCSDLFFLSGILFKFYLNLYGIPYLMAFIFLFIGSLQFQFKPKEIAEISKSEEKIQVKENFPIVWIGIIIAIIFFVVDFATLKPVPSYSGIHKYGWSSIFGLIGIIYFCFCLYRIHKILQIASDSEYPITPGKAVGFNFIPFYNIYWIFKWPNEIARFVNKRNPQKRIPMGLWGIIFLIGAILARVPLPSQKYDFIILGGSVVLLIWFILLLYITEQVKSVVASST